MIKPLNCPQLSSTKQRTGLQSIGDLIPRLIRQYELQAELMKRRAEQACPAVVSSSAPATCSTQATFGWDD